MQFYKTLLWVPKTIVAERQPFRKGLPQLPYFQYQKHLLLVGLGCATLQSEPLFSTKYVGAGGCSTIFSSDHSYIVIHTVLGIGKCCKQHGKCEKSHSSVSNKVYYEFQTFVKQGTSNSHVPRWERWPNAFSIYKLCSSAYCKRLTRMVNQCILVIYQWSNKLNLKIKQVQNGTGFSGVKQFESH